LEAVIQSRSHDSIADISAKKWDALTGTDIPFLRHEYFRALEVSGSLGASSGWTPCYLTLEDDAGALLGAVPLFEKSDSRGEFIFDWGWAAAMRRAGRPYYPKLVAAIPYTPVPGPRCLVAPESGIEIKQKLAKAARALAEDRYCSSLHWLFIPDSSLELFEADGCLTRTGCDFVWRNPGVTDFDDWLATLNARSRKKIRRERRRVAEAGIECFWRNGAELDEPDIDVIYKLYSITYYEHGMFPYLTVDFFTELTRRMPQALRVCFAARGADIVACAIFMQDSTTLYGRYWGAFEWVHSLHFELCYYQGIAQAAAKGLQTFHPGVQGEHKLLRGFEPTLHYSAHWLRDADLSHAVAQFLEREQMAIDDYVTESGNFLPYRRDKG